MNDERICMTIDASTRYDVVIGGGLLQEAGERIQALSGICKAVIVSDDQVFPLYGETLRSALEKAGIRVFSFVFAHGEASKNLHVYEQLLEYISECALSRTDLLAALGGGVTGDLCGFAAATYQRGIRFVQFPTSLLAAVDSSVGGKTAVNLKNGKNQVGCFYQPSLVLCDTDTLRTLPEKEYRNGCAEVIKYGMIMNAPFFRKLPERPAREWIREVIAQCVSMKREIVMKDEFDTGERMLLNFGHTLGHGVEKCSGYTIPHGFAVATGMAAMTRAAVKHGVCSVETLQELENILERYDLPLNTTFSPEELADAALLDKKSTGSSIRIIVPECTGRCVIRTIAAEELIHWIV